MAIVGSSGLLCISIIIFYMFGLCFTEDASKFFDFQLSYITASPLGVPQQVIAVNGKFPGPTINVTTNEHVFVNVRNKLDESALLTWPGVQMRRASWQDGVLGTNCPIRAGWNWTYNFQVKDQIGSFFYFPSLNFQRASGGFGSFIITNRKVISLPFKMPDGDIVISIGDWYTRNHTALRTALDSGKQLGMPDGVLINGKGPYQYNASVPDGIDHETINVDPGKTYRIHVYNVGVSTCLNFRIQNHNLLLAETEGYYTQQNNFTSLDIHVGQSYSFLVTMDQNASSDYYIVASPRFVNQTVWQRVTGVAILHYSNSKGKATGSLPDPPNDFYDKSYVVNQAISIRQNGSASGARPNPQGSFHYGQIQVTDRIVLKSVPLAKINGKLRATLNGISFVNPDTPIRLADKYKVKFTHSVKPHPTEMNCIQTWPEPVVRVQSLSDSGIRVIPERYVKRELMKPSSKLTTPEINIPVINLENLLLAEDLMVRQATLDLISASCREWGFFQAVNHGVSNLLMDRVRQVWREFFHLPVEEKQAYANTPTTYEGYGSRLGIQKGAKLDWSDYFFLNHLPTWQRNENKWPTFPSSCKEIVGEYNAAMVKVCGELMKILSTSLGLEANHLQQALGGDEVGASLRVNYYPKCPQPDLTFGLSPHSDPGAMTILLADDEVSGLQVRKDDNWVTVKPVPNALIVNIGDQVEVLSNGNYKSVEHRVVVNSCAERISLAFFYNPKGDKTIQPVKELITPKIPAQYLPMTFNEYRTFVRTNGPCGKSSVESIKSPR